nr:HIRAN domain-containing protein [Xanthomonas campestris]
MLLAPGDGAMMQQQGVPKWPSAGCFEVQATGSRAYRGALGAIAQNPAGQTNLTFFRVVLVPNDQNPYDSNAVAVLYRSVSVEFELLGHLSQALALDYRARMAALGHEAMVSVCDAMLSGGLEASDRDYAFVLELDLDLNQIPVVRDEDVAFDPLRQPANPEFRKDADGLYRFRCWLPGGLDGHHRKNRTKAWTTPAWDTVNYYLQNAQGIGLGSKLLSIPKDQHRAVFGDYFAEAVVEAIDKRWVTLRLDHAWTAALVSKAVSRE